ncbi:MAG: hypothetical protein ACLFUX_03230 [Spirochaetaceae bacterium]
MRTLTEFFELMERTVHTRRALVSAYLAGEVPPEQTGELRTVCGSITAQQQDDGTYRFLLGPDGPATALSLDYEVEELEKDLFFLEHGEEALYRYVADRIPRVDAEIDAVHHLLRPLTGATFVTDRDGTVNNYCGRYRSSVQSAYNAVFLTRFTRVHTSGAAILTSAPLEDFGLIDLSVMPPGTFVVGGSKGRELRDTSGNRHELPIPEEKRRLLEELNGRISRLLEEPEYRVFSLIGSAVQFKFGQSTVARQDINGSVEPKRSEAFLSRVRELTGELDPDGVVFRIEDTGYDVEVILTCEEDDRDFNKGDGLSFMAEAAGLDLEGSVVVCGDTSSDLPMLERAAETGRELRSIFVTTDEELVRSVEAITHKCVFVESPDVLVCALGMLAKE